MLDGMAAMAQQLQLPSRHNYFACLWGHLLGRLDVANVLKRVANCVWNNMVPLKLGHLNPLSLIATSIPGWTQLNLHFRVPSTHFTPIAQ
jgi:hypothetical protein